jgi:CheY-like chemotaxis protein
MNLITNASDALGDRDGVIRVTTGLVTISRNSPVVASEVLAEGNYVQLEVSDTGRGMTHETQVRVFDPFFTTKLPGHGLGLAVVQGTVRKLGGAIRVVTTPGKGTTFQILLPSAKDVPQVSRSTISRASRETLASREVTILVVEDEELIRQPVSTLLRKNGFSVIEASEGTTALDLIRAHKDEINAVLLDITMPGASTREVFEEVKRLNADVRVIVTSAYGEEMAAASLAGKVDHFLRKPFELDQLIGAIREALSDRGNRPLTDRPECRRAKDE